MIYAEFFPGLPDYMSMKISEQNSCIVSACRILCGIFLCCASLGVNAADNANALIRHYDNVLGTSMDVTIYGEELESQEAAVNATLAEIARLEQLLSTWREDSEITVLNRERSTSLASDPLLDIVEACETWLELSNGAFSCRLGQVISLWNEAEARQEMLKVPDVLPIARTARENTLNLDKAAHRIELGEGIDLEISGLAKGYIIDKAMAVLQRELPGATAIKVDIGGDASYWGTPPGENGWQVSVADPLSLSDNSDFITTLSLNGMAVATSGHQTRGWTFGEQKFSHILDTRRGWPIDNGLYSVVIAPDATTADALATTLAVLFPARAMELVNGMDDVEAMIIESNGNQITSMNWRAYVEGSQKPEKETGIELSLEYNIPHIRTGSYRAPYLAIWVGDGSGRPIKNLLLLGGDRKWARTNSFWWSRVGRVGDLPVNNVTRPTRLPGSYTLAWDGRDDQGYVMPPGEYRIMLEASREHGDHDYLSIPFTLEDGVQIIEQEGEGELGDVSLTVTLTPLP